MRKVVAFFLGVAMLVPVFTFAAGPIEINTAPLLQLEDLAGIGPSLGQRIIDGRPYSSLEGLLKVKGIGEKTLQKIKVQGLAYVSPEFAAPPPPAKTAETVPLKVTTTKTTTTRKSTTPKIVLTTIVLPKPEKTDIKASVADVSQTASNSWLLFLLAGGAIILFGGIFFAITLIKLKNDVRS